MLRVDSRLICIVKWFTDLCWHPHVYYFLGRLLPIPMASDQLRHQNSAYPDGSHRFACGNLPRLSSYLAYRPQLPLS